MTGALFAAAPLLECSEAMLERMKTLAKRRRWWLIPLGILVVLLLTAVIVAYMADEPLRRYVEGEANAAVPGYHVTVGALLVHPLTLAVELRDIVIRQDIHPDPPVLSIAHVTADAELAPLFSGQIGAAVRVDTPALSVNQKHVDGFLRRGDKEVVKEQAEAWQDKIRQTVAFRGAFYLTNGHLTYDGNTSGAQPLHVEHRITPPCTTAGADRLRHWPIAQTPGA